MEKLKLSKNGQWQLEKAYFPRREIAKDPIKNADRSDAANIVHLMKLIPEELNAYEKHKSTTPVTGKNGEKLWHHTYISDFGDDHSGRDVQHRLSRHKDPKMPGVAGMLVAQKQKGDYNTAEGRKKLGLHAELLGARTFDENDRAKGYGSQLYHNVIHHHGVLVGDYGYGAEGEYLRNHMIKQKEHYNFIDCKEEPTVGAAKSVGGTRDIFSLKDQSKLGAIPPIHLSYNAAPAPLAPVAAVAPKRK